MDKLQLKEYEIIKILISELFANIKMHTESKIGFMVADHDYKKNKLIVSIANAEYSIAKQLQVKKNMYFALDEYAIIWALRKSNSSRNEDESGGLGLFLLRKYISTLQGEVAIVSGKGYILLDKSCFDSNYENNMHIKEIKSLKTEIKGTIITLFIPYQCENNIIEKERIQNISLTDFIGE